jgi:hypothetical protein
VAVPDVARPPFDDPDLWTKDRLAVAACPSVDPDRWQDGFDELLERIAGRFARIQPRKRVRLFRLGLLAGLPRIKSWTIDLGRVAYTLAPLTYCLSMLAILASYDSPSLTEPLTDWTGA